MKHITLKYKDTKTQGDNVDKPAVELPKIKKGAFKRGDKFSR